MVMVNQDGSIGFFENPHRKTVGPKSFVILKPAERDLSRFNSLSFVLLNESQHTILVGIHLVHGTRTFRKDMYDISTSGNREHLQPEDCRELRFPRECFGTYGFRDDWTDVFQIRLNFAFEWHVRASSDAVICIKGIFGEHRRIPQGPRLSRAGLLGQIERKESLDRACAADKKLPFKEQNLGLLIPPPHHLPIDRADEIRAGYVFGQYVGVPPRWDCNPIGQLEWCHFFHRHHFLRILVQHFATTGMESDAQAINDIVTSWIQCCPVPVGSNGGAGPSGETLSIAWRMREWLWIFGVIWQSGLLLQETRFSMLASVWESARSLLDHQGHANNWIFLESAVLTILGLCFPEFKDSGTWLSTGIDRLEREVTRQFFKDGVHFEMSPLYHAICLGALSDVVQTADFFNFRLPTNFFEVLIKGSHYLVCLSRPDFTWPSLNDSGGTKGDYTALVKQLDQAIDKPAHKWIGTHGASESPPYVSSTTFPDSGVTVMRSGPVRSSHHALFIAGPPGFSHIHQDVLSLEIGALGNMWLLDPGVTTYAPHELTDYYRSSEAHNTILIDGMGPRPDLLNVYERMKSARGNAYWLSGEGIQIATGTYHGPWDGDMGAIQWTRSLIFVKNHYWIVRDLVSGLGLHEITTCWQFSPVRLKVNESCQSLVAVKDGDSRFEIRPVLPKASFIVNHWVGSLEPCAGWVSCNGLDVPAHHCRYATSAELPVQLVWLLVPYACVHESAVEVHAQEDSSTGNVILDILFPGSYRDIVKLKPPTSWTPSGSQQNPHGQIVFTRLPERSS
jgi:hypothetical protein